MVRLVLIVIVGVVSSTHILADNNIRQYNPAYVLGTHYTITQNTRSVTIVSGIASQRFKFEATDTNDPEGLGIIDEIKLLNDQVGTVKVEINGDADLFHVYGARDVKRIDLRIDWSARSELSRIRIKGNLGEDGLSKVESIGLIEVSGDLLGTLDASEAITNNISIGGRLLGSIKAGSTATHITANSPLKKSS